MLIRLRLTRQPVLEGPVPSQFRRSLEMTGVLSVFEIRDGTAV
ncbi:hypothetical protein AB0D46_05995 [Streptomyces sp. NPDC048383]